MTFVRFSPAGGSLMCSQGFSPAGQLDQLSLAVVECAVGIAGESATDKPREGQRSAAWTEAQTEVRRDAKA